MRLISSTFVLYLIVLTSSNGTAPAIASVCYHTANDLVLPSPEYITACGNPSATSGTMNCCDINANNICLSNSLCYNPNVNGGAYYLSPCTDLTYTAPECPRYCGGRVDNNEQGVIYDSQAELWRCCSTALDGSADCSNTSDKTFDAPAPNSLSVLYPSSAFNPSKQTLLESQISDNIGTTALVPTSWDFTSTPTSSALPTNTEVTRSTPTRSTSAAYTEITRSTTDATPAPSSTTALAGNRASTKGSGLQSGAITGIVVGTVAGLGFTAAVTYWLLRRYIKRRPTASDPDLGSVSLQDQPVRPFGFTPFDNQRMSQMSGSGGTATTLPLRRFGNNT